MQSRYFKPDLLLQDILVATGSSLSPTYFQMLEMEITEVLYHLDIFTATYRATHPEANPKNKLAKWGFENIEFDTEPMNDN